MKDTIKKLYESGKLTDSGVINAISKELISTDDAIDILGGESEALESFRNIKLKEIRDACNTIITNGIDVVTSNGTDHFNLSIEDQSNIGNLFNIALLGGTEYPYQADNGVCTIYTSEDIVKIYVASQSLITYQLTYHNILKSYVNDLENIEDIKSVEYGQELTGEYLSTFNDKLSVANSQIEVIVSKISGNSTNENS